MRVFSLAALLSAALFLPACSQKTVESMQDYNSVVVTFPNGRKIRAERKTNYQDIRTGMKYRDSLPADRGMLFVYASELGTAYWMYEVKLPLDIIWLSKSRQIVDIAHNAQPCPGPPGKCPTYGLKVPAMYVIELAGGVAKQNNLQLGQTLDF
jgi:hypothetical protein